MSRFACPPFPPPGVRNTVIYVVLEDDEDVRWTYSGKAVVGYTVIKHHELNVERKVGEIISPIERKKHEPQ